jgi:hypothetical protein
MRKIIGKKERKPIRLVRRFEGVTEATTEGFNVRKESLNSRRAV